MKKIILLFLVLPLFSVAQLPGLKGFTINGTIPGYADGTEVKMFRNGDNKELTRAQFRKGNFLLKGNADEPVLCYLVIGSDKEPVQLYVENSKITVSRDPKEKNKYIVNGSSSHKDFARFVTIFSPLAQQLNSLASSINSMVQGNERDGLMTIYTNTENQVQQQIDSFIMKNPASPVSPFVLSVTSQFYEDPLLLEKRYNRLDPSVKTLAISKQLEASITNQKIGAIGTQAIDFSQPDTSGIPVSLSSFRGKYVLVDFWASWCGPCRNENPNVVENFNRFRTKNFTILGVSLDRPGQKEKWLQAIRDDGLTWNHVSDLQFWNNSAAQLYHVQGIPQNILVDPQGKIVGKNLHGEALQAKLCEIFGCN